MCEIFIKIDSLQQLEVSRRTQATNPKILFMLIFQIQNYSKLMCTMPSSMTIVHFSMKFIASFECRTLTIVGFTLELQV